jgi:hypothetical protein
MFTRVSRLPAFRHYRGGGCGGQIQMNLFGQLPIRGEGTGSGYNHAMRSRIALASPSLSPTLIRMCSLMVLLIVSLTTACTFNRDRPARNLAEATGAEAMERIFWKDVQTGNWVEVGRALASNYSGVTPGGTLDRSATLDQYRSWQLKDFTLGDLNSELNGTTIVVTYSITLHGTVGSQALPSTPQHMMTVWQQQKAGWVVIAHSVSE